MAADTSPASHRGCACVARAALPATCGVAIDVPDSNSPWLPVPIAVEKTLTPLTPGAVIFGFKCPSPTRGPAELNDANWRNVGLAIVVAVNVPDAAATNAAPSPDAGDGPFTP